MLGDNSAPPLAVKCNWVTFGQWLTRWVGKINQLKSQYWEIDIFWQLQVRRTFASVHSGSHLDEIHKQRKDEILRDNCYVTRKKDSDNSALDMDFSLKGNCYTAPGQTNYVMFS